MKSKKSKIISISVFMIVVICSVIFAVGATDSNSTEYWKLIPMEIADYRKETGYEAPDYPDEVEKDKWLFAGWFDEEGNAVSTETTSGTYNAKFVPSDILGLHAQVNYELCDEDTTNDDKNTYKTVDEVTGETVETEGNAGAIRFVTSVDTLDYSKIGFKITRGTGEEEDRANNKVYQQLYATTSLGDGTSKTDEFKPKEMFNKDASTYFKTWTYTKVPSSAFDMDITVTPYWVTLDGTTVKGTTSVKCVNMGRQWKYIFVDDTGSDDEGTGTRGCPYGTLNGALAHIKKYGKSTGGEVWVLDSFTAATDFVWEDHDLDVTIVGDREATAKSKTVDFSSVTDMGINDAVTFDNMILKFQGTSSAMGRVHANGNRFEIASDVTSDNRYTTIHGGAFNGEVAETNVTILAGRYRAVYGGGCVGSVKKDTHVTLKNTDVYNTETSNDSRVHGGSNRGTVGGNTYITVGEGFNKGLGNSYKEHHHYSSVYGGSFSGYSSTIGTVKGNTYVVIEDNAKVNFIYGGGYNYSSVEGTCHVEIKGGNALSVYGGSGSVSATNSNTSVVMTGGEVEQVIGGCYSTDMTGNANVQVLGGTVTRRIFGGCYNNYASSSFFSSYAWETNSSVSGYVNVTIGSKANLTFTSDDDNSICAVSRYQDNSETETGVMVINSGQDDWTPGFAYSDSAIEYTGITATGLYTNYLVNVGTGGSVTAENGVLYIVPDSDTPYATVTYVTNDNKMLCCTKGEGAYKLPELTDRTKLQEINVTFSATEPDVSGFVVKNVVGENATYYKSLNEALEVADENTKVVVLKDIVVSNPITFTKDITFTSESAVTITRDVSLADNMFTVETGTFSIVGQESAMITIEGNSSAEGSVSARAIRVENGATCKTEYVKIQNFSVEGSAGAISCSGTLNNENTIFTNNVAASGTGGAIYASGDSDVTVTDCQFTSNTASDGGGAIHILATGTVNSNNSTYSGNTTTNSSSGNGGAIYCQGTYMDTNSSYTGNSSARHGGAIIVQGGASATITGTDSTAKFSGNSATENENGNAVYINNGAVVSITSYTFEDNTQKVYAVGALTFNNVTGATIVQAKTGVLNVSGFDTDNELTVTPYQYVVNTSVLTKADGVEDSVFEAACDAIAVTPDSSDTTKDWYINREGKLMYGEARIGDTYYSTLSAAVSAANTDGDTGDDAEDIVIYVYKDVELSAQVSITKNIAIQNEPGKTVTIKRGTIEISSNMFYVGGNSIAPRLTLGTNDENEQGKLIVDGATTSVSGARTIDNRDKATFILCKNATLQNAYSSQWGAAVINRGTGVVQLYGSIIDNTCTGAGGAVLQHGSGQLTIYEGTYTGNKSTRSMEDTNGASLGGFLRAEAGRTEIQGGVFSGNDNKYGPGGVVYSLSKASLTVTGGTFSDNTAGDRGSAFYCLGTLNCSNATFLGDTEQTIYTSGTCTFNNVTGATFIQGSSTALCVAGYDATNELKVTPYQYVANTSVLTKADQLEESVFETACDGIEVTPDLNDTSIEWFINQQGNLLYGVARIGTNCYTTLGEAITAANESTDTDEVVIYLYKDVTLSSTMTIKHNLVIQNEPGMTVSIKRGSDWTSNMFQVGEGTSNVSLTLGTNDENVTGKLIIDGGNINVTTGRLVENKEKATFVLGKNATLQNAVQTASTSWGAALCNRGTADLYGSIINNSCAGYGGVILQTAGSDTLTIHEGTYSGNMATSGNGGVIRIQGTGAPGNVVIQGGTFSDNSAKNYGGVLYSGSNATVTVKGGTFSNNTAATGLNLYCEGIVQYETGLDVTTIITLSSKGSLKELSE